MSDQDGVRDRIRTAGEQAVTGIAGIVISSPFFGQAVSAAAAARDKAIEAEESVRELLNLSSKDEAERLERRLRVLSNRLEETEDRLDDALEELRDLKGAAKPKPASKPEAPAKPKPKAETSPKPKAKPKVEG